MSVILAWRMGYFNRTSIKAGDLPHESVGGGISVPAVRLTLSPLGWVSVGRHQGARVGSACCDARGRACLAPR